MEIENVNPNVYKKCGERLITFDEENNETVDPFDQRELFGNSYLFIINISY